MYKVFVSDSFNSLMDLDALKFCFDDKEQAIEFAEMMMKHDKSVLVDVTSALIDKE